MSRHKLGTLFSLALIWGSAIAIPPPFPGGVIAIMFDPAQGAKCNLDKGTSIPARTVQYWYNGVDVWQIRTSGNAPTFRKLVRPHNWVGLRSIYDIAKEVDPKEYKCQFRVSFDPNKQREFPEVLRRARIEVGNLRKIDGVWLWFH